MGEYLEKEHKVLRVAVLGASPNRERYSNKAVRLLVEHGHEVLPVNPGHRETEGLPAYPSLSAIAGPVHTVSIYVSAKQAASYEAELLALRPERVIFNPGTEHPPLIAALRAAGMEVLEACTIVMLRTGQFA